MGHPIWICMHGRLETAEISGPVPCARCAADGEEQDRLRAVRLRDDELATARLSETLPAGTRVRYVADQSLLAPGERRALGTVVRHGPSLVSVRWDATHSRTGQPLVPEMAAMQEPHELEVV